LRADTTAMTPKANRIVRSIAAGVLIQAQLFAANCSSGFPSAVQWPRPAGWSEPRGKLFDQTWRSKDPARFLRVAADFNGDGIEDKASLLANPSTGHVGLWLALTYGDRATSEVLLDEVADSSVGSEMGIAMVGPGTYETGCGKGYWDCDSTESAHVAVAHAAIRYFKNESAESFWVWDERKQMMARVWMSD